jgi:hypothetical protein
VALAYPLLRRLFGGRVALLAGALWATEPFLVAHSQIVHVDALLTSFMLLALLAALVAAGFDAAQPEAEGASAPARRIHWRMLLLSGVAGGLAFLTKSPAVLLVPMLVLMLAAGNGALFRPTFARVRPVLMALAAWLCIAAVVWVALWPAAWVDLPGALERIFVQVAYEGTSPHGWGNFFLGRAVDDPGPLFYPVALALRLTPWTTAGLLLLLLARTQRTPVARGPAVALLLVYVLLFGAALTILPKKFDRYMLPIFPALDILAAVGMVWAWQAVQRLRRLQQWRRLAAAGLPALLGAAMVGTLLWYHPYELAYYNPLLGGGATAARLIPVGWGEGMAQAGGYIRARWNGCDRPVASWFEPVLQPFVCSPVVRLRDIAEPGRVDYAVLYIDQVQRNNEPAATALLQAMEPVHTVRIHGIDYAWVYQLPLPLEQPALVDFGERIRLHSYTLDSATLRETGTLTLTTQWQALADIDEDYLLFVHVFDEQGNRVAQVDVPPGGPRAPTERWRKGHYITWYHPVPIGESLTPGTYWLSLGLYEPASARRLPLEEDPLPEGPDDGGDALVLGPFTLP